MVVVSADVYTLSIAIAQTRRTDKSTLSFDTLLTGGTALIASSAMISMAGRRDTCTIAQGLTRVAGRTGLWNFIGDFYAKGIDPCVTVSFTTGV
jgi:hypothetical protein